MAREPSVKTLRCPLSAESSLPKQDNLNNKYVVPAECESNPQPSRLQSHAQVPAP